MSDEAIGCGCGCLLVVVALLVIVPFVQPAWMEVKTFTVETVDAAATLFINLTEFAKTAMIAIAVVALAAGVGAAIAKLFAESAAPSESAVGCGCAAIAFAAVAYGSVWAWRAVDPINLAKTRPGESIAFGVFAAVGIGHLAYKLFGPEELDEDLELLITTFFDEAKQETILDVWPKRNIPRFDAAIAALPKAYRQTLACHFASRATKDADSLRTIRKWIAGQCSVRELHQLKASLEKSADTDAIVLKCLPWKEEHAWVATSARWSSENAKAELVWQIKRTIKFLNGRNVRPRPNP